MLALAGSWNKPLGHKKKKEKSAFYFALLRCTSWLGRSRKNFGMYINREVKAEGLTATSPIASCLPCQTCWLLNGWLELLFGQLHCFCWTSVLRNTDTTAGMGRKGERNNLAELQYPSIIKYREDPVLLAKSYSVTNWFLVFPLLSPVKSVFFELGILKETPGTPALHLSFYICRLEHLCIGFWKFKHLGFFPVRKGLYVLREQKQ